MQSACFFFGQGQPAHACLLALHTACAHLPAFLFDLPSFLFLSVQLERVHVERFISLLAQAAGATVAGHMKAWGSTTLPSRSAAQQGGGQRLRHRSKRWTRLECAEYSKEQAQVHLCLATLHYKVCDKPLHS